MKVSISDEWNEDVCFEFDFENVMFRFDAASKRFYRKYYGQSEEQEVPSNDKLLFDAQSGDNRIISSDCYTLDRKFDHKFEGNLQAVFMETDAGAEDLFVYLEAESQALAMPGSYVSKPGQLPVPIGVRSMNDHESRECSFTGLSLSFMDRPKFVNDPQTYEFELRTVNTLMRWPTVTKGVYILRSRPTIRWSSDGVTVTTDPDLLCSVGGSVLLPVLDQLNIQYTLSERTLSS